MTKIQANRMQWARMHVQNGNHDTAARLLSAEIRCSKVAATKAAILAIAKELGADSNPNFII